MCVTNTNFRDSIDSLFSLYKRQAAMNWPPRFQITPETMSIHNIMVGVLTTFFLFIGSLAADPESKGRVAMSFGGSTIALWNDIAEIMEESLKEQGYDLVTHDPRFRVDIQVSDWRAWIATRRVDAIMGFPINVDAMVSVTRRAKNAGIPVVGYSSAWKGVKAATLTDPVNDGRALAGEVAEWMNDNIDPATSPNVTVLTDDGNDLSRDRAEGIIEGIQKKFPSAKIYKVTANSREAGYHAAKQHLVAHPETAIWVSFSNDNLKGAYKALMDMGVSQTDPTYCLAGMDVTNEDLDLIKKADSIYRMAFAFSSTALAEANVALLIGAAEGREIENIYVIPELVTAANADQFRINKEY